METAKYFEVYLQSYEEKVCGAGSYRNSGHKCGRRYLAFLFQAPFSADVAG